MQCFIVSADAFVILCAKIVNEINKELNKSVREFFFERLVEGKHNFQLLFTSNVFCFSI